MEKIRVRIVCCAYSSATLVKRFWDSLKPHFSDERLDLQLYLAVHGGWDDVRDACFKIMTQGPEGAVTVATTHRVNPGLSYTWNNAITTSYETDGYRRAEDVVIMANDDITFVANDVYTLASAAAAARPDTYAVFGIGTHAVHGEGSSMGHSLFAFTKAAYLKLGCFDENFFPAYCEDQDIGIRAELAGMGQEGVVLGCFHTGSAHVRGVFVPLERSRDIQKQNPLTQTLNIQYLERKWPGFHIAAEAGMRFQPSHPFNDPKYHPYYISPTTRHNPYPEHFRADRSMVKI